VEMAILISTYGCAGCQKRWIEKISGKLKGGADVI
jgi:hypothetical protein